MSVIICPLSKEADQHLRETCRGIYLDGECYAFAIALHRGLGWPMIGLMERDVIRHAVVSCDPLKSDHEFIDARGECMMWNLGKPFGMQPPYVLRKITEEDLHAIRPIQDASIRRARQLAELLWPDLPWKNSRASRTRAFAEELEALSRKHGFWIRATFMACPPMLAESKGDEGGYVCRPTEDGVTYSINRHINGMLGDQTR